MFRHTHRRHKQRDSAARRSDPQTAEGTVPPMQVRRKSRFAAIRQARRRILLLLFGALAATLIAALFTTPLLSIKRIHIEGEQNLLPEEKALLLKTVSLKPGTNWLLAPVGSMERNLRGLPWVRSAHVSRRLPDSVQVSLSLREPRFLARIQQESYELDAVGIPIRPARPEMNSRLPLIVLERTYPVRPGAPLPDEALTAAIAIYNSLQPQNIARIAKIEVDQSGNICLNMQDGIPIQMGQAEEISTKVKLVQNLYKQEPNIAARLTAVNLSCPTWPACTTRDPKPQDTSLMVTGDPVVRP